MNWFLMLHSHSFHFKKFIFPSMRSQCLTLSDPEFKTICTYSPSLTTEKCPWRRLLPQDSSSNTQVLMHQKVTAAQQTANTTNKWLLSTKCLIMQMSAVQPSDNLMFSSWVTEGKVCSNYHKISSEPSLVVFSFPKKFEKPDTPTALADIYLIMHLYLFFFLTNIDMLLLGCCSGDTFLSTVDADLANSPLQTTIYVVSMFCVLTCLEL